MYPLAWAEPQSRPLPPAARLEPPQSPQTAAGSGGSPLKWERQQVKAEKLSWERALGERYYLLMHHRAAGNIKQCVKFTKCHSAMPLYLKQIHILCSIVLPSVIAPLSRASPCWRSEASPRSRSLVREAVSSGPATDSAMSANSCSFSVRAWVITASFWLSRSTMGITTHNKRRLISLKNG